MEKRAKSSRQWMPMYWGDYSRKTAHLSTLEHGAYLLLIAHYWNTGEALPDDDDTLRRITKTSTKQFKSITQVIHSFFTKRDGKLYHDRIEEELERIRAFSTLQSSRAMLRHKNEENQKETPSRGSARARVTTTTTTLEDKTPSFLPSNSAHAQATDSGVLKNKDLGFKNFSIISQLTDIQLTAVRASVSGWDIYYLAGIYDEGVRAERREPPRHPAAAFTAWCQRYTKGKNP